ncbi:MAG: M23 family metallopeptidase [Clostridiaceae bacterium]|jgi:murein DD-endopeptidase MepM/ murein hydrolase activator NlpD|nr:M23 family metallopeptidase [Clostridiaceae bacterium]
MSKITESTARLGKFLKRNIYVILIVVCGIAVATVIGLAIGGVFTPDEVPAIIDPIPDDPAGPVDPGPGDPDDPAGPVDPGPGDPDDPTGPVDPGPGEPDDPVGPANPTASYIVPVYGAMVSNGYELYPTVFYSKIKESGPHFGIDFVAAEGTSVMASFDGVVVNILADPIYEGYAVTIEHADGIRTVYASLGSDIRVSVGDTVSQGDVIGTVGTSMQKEAGEGPHLHFEMFENGVRIDPASKLVFEEK